MTTAIAGADVEKAATVPGAGRVAPIWVVLVLLLGLFAVAHDANRAWDRWHNSGQGTLGASFADFCAADGFCAAGSVTPGGPLAKAGARDGDSVRFDRAYDFARRLREGESVGLTLRRAGALSHHVLTAVPAPPVPQNLVVAGLFTYAAYASSCLIGLFVVLRSRRRTSAFLLGAALACLGLTGSYPTLLESDTRFFQVFTFAAQIILAVSPVLFIAFANAARAETSGKTPRRWAIIFIAYALTIGVVAAYEIWTTLSATVLPGVGDGFAASVAVTDLGFLLAILALADAWRVSRGEERTRYGFMLIAIGLLSTALEVIALTVNLTGNDWSLNNPLIILQITAAVAGAGVFAYAVLRHRVLDLGFAVNRTLVYGVLSTLMLVAFGLIEWAVDRFLPLESHETSAFIDAGIALAIFLTFHRVRDFVEHIVEGVFFRSWRRKEAELSRFLKEAGFVTRPHALIEASVAAFRRFSGGEVAIYEAEGNGYVMRGGDLRGAPTRLGADMPALVRLRAERSPLDGEDSGSLGAALILPMVHRIELTGLVLFGPKPSGDAFRPDECELLDKAARQIGLDLHALSIDALAGEASDLRRDLAVVTGKYETLSLALKATGAAPA